jgi:glyoxylate/hydroxypyruvate reductase
MPSSIDPARLAALPADLQALFSAQAAMLEAGAALTNSGRGAIVDDDALISPEGTNPRSRRPRRFRHRTAAIGFANLVDQDVTALPHISAPTIVTTASRFVADNLRVCPRTSCWIA